MAMNKQVMTKDIGRYTVYSDGRIYSNINNIFLKQCDNSKGYLKVHLNLDGKAKQCKVHRIIAEAFIDNPLNKPMVNHINGIKDDNRAENLEWVTNKENAIHAAKEGLTKKDYCSKVVIDLYTGIFYNSGSELARYIGWLPTSLLAKLNGNRSEIKRYKFV